MLSLTNKASCRRWLPVLFLAVMAALVYGHTLDVPFYFDDKSSIIDNPAINDLGDLQSLWQYARLRVVTYFTFALNYHFHGLDVAGFHIVNILIHFLVGCAVLFLGLTLLRTPSGLLPEPAGRWFPLLTALFFILHPLQTQAVTYIIQRSTSLAALFYISSMACYVRARLSRDVRETLTWISGTILLASLAIFTKQNTATLPFAFLLLEVVFFRAKAKHIAMGALTTCLMLAGGYILMIFIFGAFPFSLESLDALTRETQNFSRLRYLAIQIGVLWTYIRLFFWPTDLHLDYHLTIPVGINDPLVMAQLAAHLAILITAFFMIRRLPIAAFGLIFYYLAHMVESSIIPIRDIVFEHRTYLPNLGLCLVSGWLVSMALCKRRTTALVLIAVFLISLSTLTWMRNSVWRDPVAFWQDCIKKAPGNSRPYIHLGRAVEQKGATELAASLYREALRIRPDNANAHDALGGLLAKQGDLDGAVEHFAKALQLVPDSPKSHYNMGTAQFEKNHLAQAKFHLETALQLDANYAQAHNTMGLILWRNGNSEKAKVHLHKAVHLKPDYANAHSNLGDLFLQQGRTDKAIQYYKKALRLEPGQAEIHGNLAYTYQTQGRLNEAIEHYLEALRLNPSLSDVHNFLAAIFTQQGKYTEAIFHYTEFLKRNPGHSTAKKELETVKKLKIKEEGSQLH